MKNPFVYGEVVGGSDFCDRETEVRKLTLDLDNAQKIFLISSRRFGKTSLVKVTLEKLEKQKMRTIYLDVEGISTYKKFLNTYLNILTRKFSAINKLYEFAKKLLPSIRFDLSVDETGSPTLSLGYKPEDPDLESVAAKIFELPEKIAQRQQVVIAFDEFQEILKLNGKQTEGALRAAVQHQKNVGYIFAGSKRHLLTEMVTSPDRPFYKIGPIFYLDKIPEEIFKEFIYEKFHRSGVKISKNTVSKIIEFSENIPYYVQMLSHELWDYSLTQGKEIKEKEIELVFQELLKQYSQNFSESWNKLIIRKKQLLQVIARKGGHNLLSKESLSENELGYPSSVQRTLELLIADGYIDKIDNEYFIVDILFREWVKRFTV